MNVEDERASRDRSDCHVRELHPDQTLRIEFGWIAEKNWRRRGEGKPRRRLSGLDAHKGKNRLGRFMVRGKTIRKRSEPSCDRFSSSFGCGYSICASNRKMAEVRRARSFPPLRGTREPRESGDVAGPAACAVVAHCSPPSPETPVHVDAHLALAQRWLPQPRTLHPCSDARFAATYLR